MGGNVMKVIAATGDSHLGGADFDQRLLEYCCSEFERKHGGGIEESPRALCRLRTACERAKRTLSFTVETTIEVEYLYNGIDFDCTITAAKFEDLNMDLFLTCKELVELCLKDSNVEKEDVDDVLLVGGSSRIPKVQELLQDLFDGTTRICKEVNPDEAVAVGAAIHAAMLGGDETQSIEDLILTDVTPLSLGILTVGGLMSVLIPRNTPVPVKTEKLFTTSFDYQAVVRFQVYEGECALAQQNNLLGKFELAGISPAPTGVARVLVRLEIDEDGILTVSAVDQKTKGKADIVITKYGSVSKTEEENERMVEDGRKNKESDEEIRRKPEPARTPRRDRHDAGRPSPARADSRGIGREGELHGERKEEPKHTAGGGRREPPMVQHPHSDKMRVLMKLLCLRNK